MYWYLSPKIKWIDICPQKSKCIDICPFLSHQRSTNNTKPVPNAFSRNQPIPQSTVRSRESHQQHRTLSRQPSTHPQCNNPWNPNSNTSTYPRHNDSTARISDPTHPATNSTQHVLWATTKHPPPIILTDLVSYPTSSSSIHISSFLAHSCSQTG